jgi:hypothetical protein
MDLSDSSGVPAKRPRAAVQSHERPTSPAGCRGRGDFVTAFAQLAESNGGDGSLVPPRQMGDRLSPPVLGSLNNLPLVATPRRITEYRRLLSPSSAPRSVLRPWDHSLEHSIGLFTWRIPTCQRAKTLSCKLLPVYQPRRGRHTSLCPENDRFWARDPHSSFVFAA